MYIFANHIIHYMTSRAVLKLTIVLKLGNATIFFHEFKKKIMFDNIKSSSIWTIKDSHLGFSSQNPIENP